MQTTTGHAAGHALTIILMTLGLLGVAADHAHAQESVGVRAGVSGDPDQFVFGGHLETAPLLDRLVFRPSGEIGLGDDLTVVSLNFEFAYKLEQAGRSWNPYVGGGPALNIFRFDNGRRNDETEIEGGFNILVGVEHEDGLFTEFKIGALDSPDLKFLVGYAF